MEPVHVLALVVWVGHRQVPLGHILLRRGSWATMLATERIHCQSEQTGMFVALLYLDGIQS